MLLSFFGFERPLTVYALEKSSHNTNGMLLCGCCSLNVTDDVLLLQSLMRWSDWASLTPPATLRSASSPTSCFSSERPVWVRVWWTRWRPAWRRPSTPPHGLTYRCPPSSVLQLCLYMNYQLILFFILALAVLADFAQLPVIGGCRDVDQPGHEKH